MKKSAKEKYIENLKSLHNLLIKKYNSYDELFDEMLQAGLKIFNCESGIISRIKNEKYNIWSTINIFDLEKGLVFDLEDTFCKFVVEEKKTVCFNHAGKLDKIKSHPAYENMKLETYISTPIFVGNEVFGTLNFSSQKIRKNNFNENEIEFIKLMAQTISHYIELDEVKKREIELSKKNIILKDAVKNLSTTIVAPGVFYISIPEASLYILCGSPEDVVKHLKQKGIIVKQEKDGVEYEVGPNAILLSDSPVQNSLLSNLGEFPILHMFYTQGMIVPNHPNNDGSHPIIIGRKDQVEAQLEYLYRGNYGLISKDEILSTIDDKTIAEELWQIKKYFAFGKLKPSDELIDSVVVEKENTEIKNGVYIKRLNHNVYEISYQENSVKVDLNLKNKQVYEAPFNPGFSYVNREYFAVLHTGEGNGWDINRPCMSSIILFKGKIYIIDAGPNVLNILMKLGIDTSEIDGIFQTHTHDDHFAGMPALMLSDHKIKYFASKTVIKAAQLKMCSLLGIVEEQFNEFFDIIPLILNKWNNIEGLDVMPVFSPHPVETNIFKFRVKEGEKYYSYSHLADICSFDVLNSMQKDSKYDALDEKFVSKIMDQYLYPADLKKIDIGGGLIHGDAKNFDDDKSSKILLAHKDVGLTTFEKEIGSETSFGVIDDLIKKDVEFDSQKIYYYLKSYFSEVKERELEKISNCNIEIINPGTVLFKKGQVTKRVYLILSGIVEFIDTEQEIQTEIPAGSIIGDHAIIHDTISRGTLRTVSHVKVLKIPGSIFLDFLNSHNLKQDLKEKYIYISNFKLVDLFKEKISFPVYCKLAKDTKNLKFKKGSVVSITSSDYLYITVSGEILVNDRDENSYRLLKKGEYIHKYHNQDFTFKARTDCSLTKISFKAIKDIPVAYWKYLEKRNRL